MKEITLRDYRCFHEKQVSRLAPLTLLVGDNSTGKTSFLAIIRALWDCIYGHRIPNFKEAPFDIGTFEQIAYRQNGRAPQSSTFEVKIHLDHGLDAEFEFGKQNTAPVPIKTCLGDNGVWLKEFHDGQRKSSIHVTTPKGSWETSQMTDSRGTVMSLLTSRRLLPTTIPELFFPEYINKNSSLTPIEGSPYFSPSDSELIANFRLLELFHDKERPFASAPVRSQPQRTYSPDGLISNPEGDNSPMILANLAFVGDKTWTNFKDKLEQFGSSAGIFDEIDVNRLGKSQGSPFEIQIRKYGSKRKGLKQNLIDVGYGVSQVLPILTELLLPESDRIALLQQPEVHLHPSAQAALGSLLCKISGQGRQLIVETHSDHLLDRVRMDVRDGKTDLKPEDVSILFFERNDLSVQIHSIRLDHLGNIFNAPVSYRKFFMEETRRSLWG
ncbi:MAG: AAA family ATPase [Bacteroidetes bacterium]|nr:AAA family ATPase [Bacteroidota bacterium]